MKKNRLSRDRHYTLSINSLEKVEEEEVDKDVPKDVRNAFCVLPFIPSC